MIIYSNALAFVTPHLIGKRQKFATINCRSALEWGSLYSKFSFWGYIVGYTFGNYVLRLSSRVAVKLNSRPYIRRYTSPNENLEFPKWLTFVVYCDHTYHTSVGLNSLQSFFYLRLKQPIPIQVKGDWNIEGLKQPAPIQVKGDRNIER